MTNKEALSIIRKFKGQVYAGVIVRNDVIYVQVVKIDLVKSVAGLEDESINVTERHGALYIDN